MCISHFIANNPAMFNSPNFYDRILCTKLYAKGTTGNTEMNRRWSLPSRR